MVNALGESAEGIEVLKKVPEIDYVDPRVALLDEALAHPVDNIALSASVYKIVAQESIGDSVVENPYDALVKVVREIFRSGDLPMGLAYDGDYWDRLVNDPAYRFSNLAGTQFVKDGIPKLLENLEREREVFVFILGIGNGSEIQDLLSQLLGKVGKITFVAIDQNKSSLEGLAERYKESYKDEYGEGFEIKTVYADFRGAKEAIEALGLLVNERKVVVMKGITSGNMPLSDLDSMASSYLKAGDLFYVDASNPAAVDREALLASYDNDLYRQMVTSKFYAILNQCGIGRSEIEKYFKDGKDANLSVSFVDLPDDRSYSIQFDYNIPEEWAELLKKKFYIKLDDFCEVVRLYVSTRRDTNMTMQALSRGFTVLSIDTNGPLHCGVFQQR